MTISLPQRVPENAPGDFYVEAGSCMLCGLPHSEAPELMNDSNEDFWECYFRRQPQTPEELNHAIDAICVSDLGCLRYGGTDQAIIRRLHERGCGDRCDHPLLGEPAVRRLNPPATPAVASKKSWWRWLFGGAG
jgi:hypothetical protein